MVCQACSIWYKPDPNAELKAYCVHNVNARPKKYVLNFGMDANNELIDNGMTETVQQIKAQRAQFYKNQKLATDVPVKTGSIDLGLEAPNLLLQRRK